MNKNAEKEKNILEQLKDDPFVKLCWWYSVVKFVILGLGTLGVFLYVVISCLIDKM